MVDPYWLGWLWLVPGLPLASFLVLALVGGGLGQRGIALVAAGGMGLSAVLAGLVGYELLTLLPPDGAFRQTLWTWMSLPGFEPTVALHLDRLSLVTMLVVTGVGFLIFCYAAGYMAGDSGYRRFFAYMSLFAAFMLILVLAGDLLLLFLGWEGVGLCSYLLIGFWYQDPDNGRAAQKAFIVTRIGDAAFIAGLLVLFTGLGTTDIGRLLERAVAEWPAGSVLPVAAAALLLGGAVGKSAQLPLQVWLPDAMAGPTPVSALIHAATMVTAGVYLIGRLLPLYELAPPVLALVGLVGALTLLIAAVAALGQHDIKRILAYSTMSQIGYMVLALGVGAVSAAMFHLVTHAFFKALLFLSAGAVILSLGGEHDVFKMGGLRRTRPIAFWTFLIGAACLAALPLVTSGFYSKSAILDAAWSAGPSGRILWLAGALGALLTSLYIFRAVFLVFFGPQKTPATERYGLVMSVPMLLLALLSLVGGWLPMAGLLAPFDPTAGQGEGPHLLPELVAVGLSLLGIALAYGSFRRTVPGSQPQALGHFAEGGLGFDTLYDRLLVRPFRWIAAVNRRDLLDGIFEGLARIAGQAHRLLALTQTGILRWYAAGTLLGGVLLVGGLILAGARA